MVSERGGGPALVAVLLGGLALAMVLVAIPAEVRIRMARAQWAADATARAAAAEVVAGLPAGGPASRSAAAEMAAANGAELVSIDLISDGGPDAPDGPVVGTSAMLMISPIVVVTVELGGVEARAGAGRFVVTDP